LTFKLTMRSTRKFSSIYQCSMNAMVLSREVKVPRIKAKTRNRLEERDRKASKLLSQLVLREARTLARQSPSISSKSSSR